MSPRTVIITLLCCAAALLVGGLAYWGGPQAAGEKVVGPLAAGSAETPEMNGPAEWATGDLASGSGQSAAPADAPLRITGGGDLLFGLGAIKDGKDREAYLDGIIGRLAALGPEAALAQVQQLPDAELRDAAMLALLQEWSGVSTLELIRSGNIWRFGASGALGLYLLEQGRIAPEQAAQMARASTDANRRSELLARVASRMENPAAALAMADGLDERQRQRFVERLASELAEQSPEDARAFAASVTDPAVRSLMLARVLENEASRDPSAAARNFLAMPPDAADQQDRAARRIAQEWAARDTLSAMQWASSLPSDSVRESAQQGIEAAAPVGIGARVGMGAGGVPILEDLVPGGPASASGQLQAGDSILAVSDANGSWVDSRSVRMGDLIGLIRGQANTQVSLQVQSPGDAAPRTITLGRQQIIFRPD